MSVVLFGVKAQYLTGSAIKILTSDYGVDKICGVNKLQEYEGNTFTIKIKQILSSENKDGKICWMIVANLKTKDGEAMISPIFGDDKISDRTWFLSNCTGLFSLEFAKSREEGIEEEGTLIDVFRMEVAKSISEIICKKNEISQK